jgi:flavin-dependent dehydrogenase
MIRSSLPSSAFDTVVAGARCAGAATAMLLAGTGRRVLLIDRGRYGTDTLSTHALMRGAVVQLQRWGVLPAVVAAGTPPVRSATFFYGGDAVTVPVKPRDGVDALYAPRRRVLDRLLVDAASAAGADVVFGARVIGVERSASGRVIGVVVADESGREQAVSSRMLVGADGLRSSVARMVNAPIYRFGQHATATMYGHWRGLSVDGYQWYFGAGVAAGAIPTSDGETCVFVSVPSHAFSNVFAHRIEPAFADLLRQAAPDLAAQLARVDPVRLHGFAGHSGYFRQSYGAGWSLVGDAGYFKDPLTSHGITDALRDAELLADAIDEGSDAALAAYQSERDGASLELFETTDEIASFTWDLHRVRALHDALARAMAREVRQLVGASRDPAAAAGNILGLLDGPVRRVRRLPLSNRHGPALVRR